MSSTQARDFSCMYTQGVDKEKTCAPYTIYCDSLFGPDYFCEDGVCVKNESYDAPVDFSISCTDTDGGKNYYEKGTTTWGPINGKIVTTEDSCVGSTRLAERYCYDSKSLRGSYEDTEYYYICPNGCEDGACVKVEKSCWSDSDCKLNEEFCEFDPCEIETGKCVKKPEECAYVYEPVCGCDDVTYSNDCARQMQSVSKKHDGVCVGEEQEELCDYAYLNSGGTKIYLGESINKVKSVLTKNNFPAVLNHGRFFGDVEAQYTQVIYIGSYPTIEYSKAPTSSDEIGYNIKLSASSRNYLYNETVTFSRAIDMSSRDSRGERIRLFGKDYRIGMGSTENLILLENSEKLMLDNNNPTTKINIDGEYYTIELVSGSDIFALIKVTDSNGNVDAKQISEDEIKIINGILVGVNNVDETNLGIFAILIVGSKKTKLTFCDGCNVVYGEDDTIIDGTLVDFGRGGLKNLTRLTISVYAPASDKDAIRLGESFTDPLFGTLEMIFESYDDVNGAKIKLVGCVEEEQCIPNYFCVAEPAVCPSSGVQIKKCVDIKCGTEGYEEEIICDPGMCTGCKSDDKCIPYGFRIKIEDEKLYCDIDGELKEQKTPDAEGNLAECQNNYECESNVCSSGECVEIKKMLEEANKFKSFAIKTLCRLVHLFNDDKYNQCVYNFLGEESLDKIPPIITIINPVDGSTITTDFTWVNVTTGEEAVCEYSRGHGINIPPLPCEEGEACPGGSGSGVTSQPKEMSVTGGTEHLQLITGLKETINDETQEEWYFMQVTCGDESGNSNPKKINFYVDLS